MASWPVQKFELNAPSLQELVEPLAMGLASNFQHSSVEVASCPNLTLPPFNLAAPGICGSPRIADIGGPPNLSPIPKFDRKYSFTGMARLMEMGIQGAAIGASAGPFHIVGVNSELMPNWSFNEDAVTNRTHYAKIDEKGQCLCERLDSEDFGLMGNLFASEGRQAEVLKITARVRTGKNNFTTTLQAALKKKFKDHLVSMGGVFVIKKGKANLHVMPDFSSTPLRTPEEVNNWLRFFDMRAPLVCLSVFHSHDPGWDLRMEHTHCFSDHNEGGHYHDDITPEEVEYEAYFNVADILYRIDRPGNSMVIT